MEENKPKFLTVPFPENGIVRIYNQFPRRYQAQSRCVLQEMIEDLPRIAEMGFNSVWINPIQLTGKVPAKTDKKGNDLKGSLYATASDIKFNPDFFEGIDSHQARVRLVQEYTTKARELGLIPMFDLVLNHVGLGTELEEKYKNYLKGPTKRWPDISEFNYEKPEKREDVIKKLWKPFIERYIGEYGFGGVRVDAITNVNTAVQKEAYQCVTDCCKKYHNTKPIILGELMVRDPKGYIDILRDVGFSHVFVSGSLYRNFIKEPELNEDWLLEQAKELQKLIWNIANQASIETEKKNYRGMGGIGGSAGLIGNHDVATLKAMIIFHAEAEIERKMDGNASKVIFDNNEYKEFWRKNQRVDPEDKARSQLKYQKKDYFDKFTQDYSQHMKEKILRVAIACNGGWYLLAGDEYGLPHTPKVFDNYHEETPLPPEKNNWKVQDDLTDYIRCLNLILGHLPKTCLGDYATYDTFQEIGPVVVRYSGDEDEKPSVICYSDKKQANYENILKRVSEQLKLNPNLCNIYIINDNKVMLRPSNGEFHELKKAPIKTIFPESNTNVIEIKEDKLPAKIPLRAQPIPVKSSLESVVYKQPALPKAKGRPKEANRRNVNAPPKSNTASTQSKVKGAKGKYVKKPVTWVKKGQGGPAAPPKASNTNQPLSPPESKEEKSSNTFRSAHK